MESKTNLLSFPEFWGLIDLSLQQTSNEDQQIEFLQHQLLRWPAEKIAGFRLLTDQLLTHSYADQLWCAAYIMNRGCSDDGFEYFRCWLIARGQKAFEQALEHPDSLMEIIDEEQDLFEQELFWYVALEPFEQKTGQALYDFMEKECQGMIQPPNPPFEFSWEEAEPESMRKICPRLFDHFWS